MTDTTTRPEAAAASSGRPVGADRRWRVLGVMCVPLVLVVAANSGLHVALPAIVAQVGATQTQLQWIVDAYALVFAGLVLPAGALGDRFGRRRALLVGLAVFGAGAVAAPVMAAPAAVIAARAVMGVGSALVMPATLSILTALFPVEERGRAIGVWAGFAGGGAAAGPVVSGLLLEWYWWGSVFYVNLPLIVVAVMGTLLWVPVSREAIRQRLDPIGGLLSVVALASLLFAIIEAPERGLADPATLGAAVAAVAFSLGFVWWQRRAEHPMVEPSWFTDRRFTVGAATITLTFVAGIGFGFLLPQYLQFVLDYSPLQAGLASLPFAAAMLLAAPRSDDLVRRLGPATAVSSALAAMALSLAYLAVVSTTGAGLLVQIPGLAVVGAAIGLATAPCTAMILAALPDARAGVGSAVNDATRELGIALGVALLGSVLTGAYRAGLSVDGLDQEAAVVARQSVGAALELSRGAGTTAATSALADAARLAFTGGYRLALLAAAGIVAVAAGAVARFGPAPSRPDDERKGSSSR